MPAGELRIRLLGGLEIEGIAPKELGSRKARTLLKLLALARGAPVSADRITDVLWGDEPPSRPVDQIGVLVSRLRPVLGPDRLARGDAGWSLAVDWLDVDELEARVDEAAARLDAESHAAALAAARAALELVRGELLADEPDAEWAEAERFAVARAVARARVVAAGAALGAGHAGDAAAAAELALDHDPYDEAALRVLMRAHVAAGRPASALAAYARVRARLSEDLGVDPTATTEELHTAILLGDVSAPAAVDEPASPRVLVGRAAECAALDARLAAAAGGAALATVVEGEAGIGKTALLDEWVRRVAPRALVLFGRCDELGRDLPLQPLLDGLASVLRALPSEDAADVLGDATGVIGPMLGDVSLPPTGDRPTTVVDAEAAQAALFASLLAVVERAAGDRPAVVVIEDIHLAGSSTLEWLHFAVRRGRRLLVVASRRSEEGRSLANADRIALGPLDLAAVAELVGASRAEDLLARSGGHPLFLVELAAAETSELPASVRESVEARLAGLGDAAATLRTAAVLGAEIDVDALAGVLGLPVSTLLEHVDDGVRARVIEERAGVLRFRHELVRDALFANTTAARRAFIHREAARALRERPRHDPLEVAWHAQRGGDAEGAAAAYVDAAAVAFDRHDVATAEELLGQAVALHDTIDARLARARVRVSRWDHDRAQDDADRALALGAGAAGIEVAAWVAYYRRDYEQAMRFAERALEHADDDGLRASCLAMTGRVLHAKGALHESEGRLERAVADAPPAVRGLARMWLSGLRVHQGRLPEAYDLVEEALFDGTWFGHPFAQHHGFMYRTLSLGQRGRVTDAFAAVELERATAEAAGETGHRFLAAAENVRSWLLRNVGLVDDAVEISEAVIDRTAGVAALGEMHHAALLDAVEAHLLRRQDGAVDDAIARAAAVDQFRGSMDWHHREHYGVARARHELRTGDAAAAREHARQASDDAAARGARRYAALGRTVAAIADASLGEALDHDAVDATLRALDECAALEAWLLTAELAAVARQDRWWRDAERRAGELIAASGPYAESLRRLVSEQFSALGRR